ncbi:MAG: zinc-binding dehydrogenase, partial [Spongiibacteraceae bacterium]
SKHVTRGGFSDVLVVDERFALKIPGNLDQAAAAPLLCAGITTYSAMRKWHVGPGKNIGVVGLGGLGHMALKFAKAFGAKATLFTSRPEKAQDAFRLGATAVESSVDPAISQRLASQFDYIIDTVSAPHDLNAFLTLLKPDGVHCMVGMPNGASPVFTNALIYNSRSLSGSQIGGLRETQEMLDFCGKHNIVADIEKIGVTDINKSFERMHKSDVKYRFVVDLTTLKNVAA